MFIGEQQGLSQLLYQVATSLDIPDAVYEDATLKYDDIAQWLGADDSALKAYHPQIYVQGSFRLGTPVRPISEVDEFDIDLVCVLELEKDQTTQARLKQKVGDRLTQRADIARMLDESRRVWTLDYPNEQGKPHFHMDVLPSILNREHPPTAILITDTDLVRWQKSNPIAYAEWFFGRMRVVFEARKALLAKSISATVEDVPDWQVRTPLQRAVQVLKRHRDLYFQRDHENLPCSILLTTLAARAYSNQPDTLEAFAQIAQRMPEFIQQRNGRWWIENPVEPDENFADKWNEYPERHQAFMRWLRKVQRDFADVGQSSSLNEAARLLAPVLGPQPVFKAATDLGLGLQQPPRALSFPLSAVQELGSTTHCLPPAWPLKPRFRADVNGSVHRKDGGPKLWNLSESSVPKGIWLRFAVTTNTPMPYEVRWQVVNTGKEASAAQQLRGDYYGSDASNSNVRWETTRYNGTHWVEAFIIKGATCVARSGRKYVRVRP